MANRKISALTQLASTAIVSGDKIPIVDASDTTDDPTTGTTKYVDGADVFYKAVGGTVTANTTFAGTVTLASVGGSVGLNTTTPRQRLEIVGTNGTPSTAGTVPSSGFLRLGGSFNNVLDFGAYNASPFTVWIQAYDRSAMSSKYSIAINPTGGSVAIGGSAPASLLDVNGTAQVDGLRIDQTPTSGAVTLTHYVTVNLNGTTYRIPCGTA